LIAKLLKVAIPEDAVAVAVPSKVPPELMVAVITAVEAVTVSLLGPL
jgi:hypothetical protein